MTTNSFQVYDVCGSLSITSTQKQATVSTYLPEMSQPSAFYKYTQFFNISNEDCFGVLAVMEVMNSNPSLNIDLDGYNTSTDELRAISNSVVDLTTIPKGIGDKEFVNLTTNDEVYFICFHSTDFDARNSNEGLLKLFQENLPNYANAKQQMAKPKWVGGGVLNILGCPE